ncbi:hypothetical protein FHX74_002375 [Friedmanniella endophytica]|uniref:Uncharacterized protein n=1 Tax=Microlunatus kandeliicorticis TaxID=1759536 RepID=A0A7W3IT42_9ACTN|nr:hypothetical protein [Microlunatus kandeliicorticis]MBA8794756.1 hypothetical protein [Microlunatus kandeliicorticis]
MVTEVTGAVLFAVLVVARVLASIPVVRRRFDRDSTRLAVWLRARAEAADAPTPAELLLAALARRDRLRRDLDRILRLLDVDETMSATRQLGNRLAHRWLVVQLREADAVIRAAGFSPLATAPTNPPVARRGRTVEVLDAGGWPGRPAPSAPTAAR